MKLVKGDSIEKLWFNLLVDVTCGVNQFDHPIIFSRHTFAETENFVSDNKLLRDDFFKYSGYHYLNKMGQLRKEYYTGKVEKQFNVIKKYFHQFVPRQSRAAIYFSEPAYDKTAKLKCLESMYFQKFNKINYEVFLTFRNTEVYPKLYMDFLYIKELIDELDYEAKVKCVKFNAIIINSFINMHQVKLIHMFLTNWGISNFSDNFLKFLVDFDRKYDFQSIHKIKLTSIKRVLERTFRLENEAA
jgi:hypothetical protein